MKDSNYIIKRDDLYVGIVVRTDIIRRFLEGGLTTGRYKFYRSMLYVLNKDSFAEDLLYDSKNYPVLNYTSDDICLNLDANSILVKRSMNLGSFLKFFGYKELLTFSDIVEIKKRFFNGSFTLDNCELFGFKEYSNFIDKILDDRKFFLEKQKAPLSKRYWKNIDYYGYKRDLFVDSFTPDSEEGKVKKLTKTR